MAIDAASPRTRRALLTAALGAGAATVASALGRPLPARAGVDGDVVLGATNSANTTTQITTGGATAIKGVGAAGIGLYGVSDSGYGVRGDTDTGEAGVVGNGGTFGNGVEGVSGSSVGVYGETGSDYNPAIYGRGGWHGVYGEVAQYDSIPWPINTVTGVWGAVDTGATSVGVYGQTLEGHGIKGTATTGHGVTGQAATGTAGYFASTDVTKGFALRAVGRVKLDKCAGVATIAVGTKSVAVTPGIDLVSTSAVVATLQGNPGGTTAVQRVAVNTTANTFTIYLTGNSTANVKVAWHVFG